MGDVTTKMTTFDGRSLDLIILGFEKTKSAIDYKTQRHDCTVSIMNTADSSN